MANEPHSVGDILDAIEKLANKDDRVTVGHVVEALGSRGFGPFLIVMPLIDISPIGSIPGLPTAMAAVIVLIAVQMALGRRHLWLPGVVRRRSIDARKAGKAVEKTRGIARFMDRWFHGRIPALTTGPFVRIAAIGVIALACTVPPLELLPLATTVPMLAIAAFGLAITVRDGALMIVAMMLAVAAAGLGLGLLSGK
ncbi:MAG: hypothetical protein DI544_09345 [Sphingomonas taxi]|uniref:Exopolysaccharide biosynthesis protein n=1 Tax=Sphingomonas taxi TaxID=1549858 RepID=A0A2W5R9V4_9SPHN|nr:MAG: hypothetical protein DI544_09345 [Sphingomonas taxi]